MVKILELSRRVQIRMYLVQISNDGNHVALGNECDTVSHRNDECDAEMYRDDMCCSAERHVLQCGET